jgi:hypothetical protein
LVGRKRKTEALFSLALHHHAIVVYFIVDCCLFLVFRFQSKSFTYHLFNDRYISYRHVMFKSYLSPIASSREEKTGEKQKTTGEVWDQQPAKLQFLFHANFYFLVISWLFSSLTII